MSPARNLEVPYRNVVSAEVIATVNELLRVTSPMGLTTSLVLSGLEQPRSNLLQLKGLGKEIWHGEDAQAYVNRLRQEWDE
jgi:hypothetical protein